MAHKRRISDVEAAGNDHWHPRIAQIPRYPAPVSNNSRMQPPEPPDTHPKRPRTDPESSSASLGGPKVKERLSRLKKTERIMAIFDKNYKLGDFLQQLFDPDNIAPDKLSESSRKMLSSWIRGETRIGSRPTEVFDAVYRHPYGINRPNYALSHSDFPDLLNRPCTLGFTQAHPQKASLIPQPIPAHPSRANSREGLEELMVRGTLVHVEREAQALADAKGGLARGADLTWELLSDPSNFDQRTEMMSIAPVIWAIFATMASTSPHNNQSAAKTGGHSNGLRDPTLVSMSENLMGVVGSSDQDISRA